MTDDLGTVVLVTAAIGEPGQRVFYLQAQGPLGTQTVKCEKGQVAALAEHLEQLLADLPATATTPAVAADFQESWSDVTPRFVLGTIGLAYDADTDRVVVLLEEVASPEDDEDDEIAEVERDGLRLEITRGVASVFCARAREIVAAGRPSCRWCGRPMDPDGHPCPRMN
jgi:uncharacterized repeat protein (TIGR03847 family)